jgi:outer membrane lipoprotein
MKQIRFILITALFFLTACAPVFREEIMKNATLNPSLAELNAAPSSFEGRMFIIGGRIISSSATEEGVVLEALYLPVDSRGYIDFYEKYRGRFLAIMPKSRGILDPLIFVTGRDVTIAGTYRGVRKGMIDKLEFSYSYFEIVGIRLWEESYYYYGSPFYDPYPYYFFWYGPRYERHIHPHPR